MYLCLVTYFRMTVPAMAADRHILVHDWQPRIFHHCDKSNASKDRTLQYLRQNWIQKIQTRQEDNYDSITYVPHFFLLCSKGPPLPSLPRVLQRVQLLASLYSEQLCIQLSADQRGVWEARIGVDASVGSAWGFYRVERDNELEASKLQL